ncbi:unnamed protein product [Arctia plantaginis]|uniref:Mitochondrial ATPase inhibitor n=1 Tax=Arctia plantaginis TaxID=874455 RepID=A0A8S0ZH57_ARCPL|nr:unnamed protein product [Arctia plantaginis]CAB3251646.1 unnamed protein product [Arctia plantaginis]
MKLLPIKSSGKYCLKSLDCIVGYSFLGKRCYTNPAGMPGSGVGKGGGGGGSIREAGGGLGRFGSAQEEAYFQIKQREELNKIKKQLKENPELPLKKKDK